MSRTSLPTPEALKLMLQVAPKAACRRLVEIMLSGAKR